MRVYEAIVRGLESVGVRAAFGGAGENAAGLMLALKHSKQIRPVITRHEQAAAFMACGQAMYTDQLGFCFATAGPGAFNLFSGLAVAMSDSYPVLAVSGFSARAWRGKGALNETSGAGRTPNSQAMFAATTKGSFLLTDIGQTCDVLEEAVNLAFEGRPGPVHIHVPEDLAHPDVKVGNYHDVRLRIAPVLPDPARVADTAAALADALVKRKRVLALIGFGVTRSRAGAELAALLNRWAIPFVTTLDGKGNLDDDDPLAVGLFCDSGQSEAWKAFVDAEVVLAIGNSFAQHATFAFRPDLFDGKTLIHINISEDEIDKVYKADHAVIADAKLALDALYLELTRLAPPAGDWRPARHDHSAEHIIHLGEGIHPGQLAQALSARLPKDAFVLADAGAHLAWLGFYLRIRRGQLFRKPGSFGPMAGHVNGAIGLKSAYPERPVIVGCGDGGYGLAGFELMTAVQYGLPVIWIIFNDGEFKLIKIFQMSTFLETGLCDFANPDWAAYAAACGAAGYTVRTLAQFEAALEAALAEGRPTVIDAHITRLALPHYSPSPHGVLAGVIETLGERLHLP
ncbi:MAG TPA: thiamine pyrophosphate-binding protein [Caulobacteraceae bacterium]|nr:thiamine pyrophosphate-binding protein [Caulobacteraceae bacterium]